jgi:colanic acid/amylovoran biosynthesis glycosyltransferase
MSIKLNALRQEQSKKFILLTVGRLHPIKNHAFLIKACFLLKQRGHEVLCLIIGEGETKKKLTHLVRSLNLNREVKLLGVIDRRFIDVFYQLADVFVLTSKSEGLPLTIMEAMLNERIVLAPKITGIPEIITDGVNGFLYQKENLQAFIDKMVCIFEKYKGLQFIGKQARSDILKYFNRKKNMEAFAEVVISHLNSAILTDKRNRCVI